jgi:hypothetical protein
MERVQYALSIATNQGFLPERQAVSKVDRLAFCSATEWREFSLNRFKTLQKPLDRASLRHRIYALMMGSKEYSLTTKADITVY